MIDMMTLKKSVKVNDTNIEYMSKIGKHALLSKFYKNNNVVVAIFFLYI